MTQGKTNVKHWRLYIDGIDVSGVMRAVGGVGITFQEEDVTGISDGVINFSIGHGQASITGLQSVFDNTAAGAHAELSVIEQYITSLHMGIKAAPTYGDPAFACPLGQSGYSFQGDGPVTVSWELNGPHQDNTLPSKVWGKVLYPPTSIAATTVTTANQIDFGAAQSNGAYLYLQITALDGGGTWTIKVEDSLDGGGGGSWADYGTFSADGQTVLGELKVVTASMDRYVRMTATDGGAGTGFTPSIVVIPQ
ncbi:hypothetical protein LCGC14_0918670 [marine sediment metagenome]|uniref:Uncharacterized protein n=1 Tax=marine sediment metagenome TaxID=412755 RepID=A0A0F9NRK6_9ZZZZ